jgi:hypothetical protein
MADSDDDQRKGAPKGADFDRKFKGAPKKKAALAAALRANLARRKQRERALNGQTRARDGGDSKTDSEG